MTFLKLARNELEWLEIVMTRLDWIFNPKNSFSCNFFLITRRTTSNFTLTDKDLGNASLDTQSSNEEFELDDESNSENSDNAEGIISLQFLQFQYVCN